VAGLLRLGTAGSKTAADHITAAKLAPAQSPRRYRRGRKTLIRTDTAGGTHEFVNWLSTRGRWLAYSVGMTFTNAVQAAVLQIPASAWTPAIEPDGRIRDGAWVAELGGRLLHGRPDGIRLIVRKERPHPGRPTALHRRRRHAPDLLRHQHMPIAELELRHRRRARAEDRIRAARATGLPTSPFTTPHSTAPDLAGDRADRPGPAGLDADARPHRPRPIRGTRHLRLRLLHTAGRLVTTGRRHILRLAAHWPWTSIITDALARLAALPNPG
jgi:hypothetical protein